MQQQQGNQQRESADGAAAAESAALAAQARLADVEQALQSVHAAAASCDPAATLVSGRAAGLQAQMQVLSECAELAQEAQHLRSTIHGALALPPATGSAGAMPGPTAQAEVGSVASSAAASSLPAASAADVASAAADALSASTVDPLISSLVTRALGGRFAAAASSAIAASVTHDVHALLKRLEHCPFTVLAAELAAHGYHTLHDLADISPHAARILISSILTSMDAGDGAAADAAARTAAPAVADGAVHAPFPAHHPANGPKAPSLVPLASSGASATASATAGQPPPWFVESGSGSRSILLHAPLVSPIDRGVVVPDVMAVLG